jgi:peptidoglycan/LPS O-acetylase OafA/YrhL
MKLNYRADIDGLRAIAVMAVVLNHAGISLFSGGFIGVDVFFVISGFLITGIIVREIEAGEFSLARFYERRIRRIYPALFAFIPFVIIAGALLYNAENFESLGKSVVAATFFVSNFHFWTETGYFEGPAQLKPLLHTWSLAVEEQYYIFFPLLMILLARYFKKKLSLILSAIAVLSFGASVYTVYYGDPSTAFYLAHTRIWELLVGCILAINANRINASPAARSVLSFGGLVMIFTPIFLYSENTPFPGLASALPVFGAALVIFGGMNGSTLANRLLSLSPLVFVGQISYSLYLWHWPVFIYGKYYAIQPLSAAQILMLLAVVFIPSILSWRFIERPFREKTILKGRNIFVYSAGIMVTAALLGSIIYLNAGFPQWEKSAEHLDKNAETRVWSVPCRLTGCPIGSKTAEPSFVLWGDSLAPSLSDGISLSAAQHGLAGRLVYANGCAPLLGIKRAEHARRCLTNNDEIVSYVERNPNLRTVILASRWALWVEGTPYSFMEDKENIVITDSFSEENSGNPAVFERGLIRTVEKLAEMNRGIVIISQVPEIGYDVPSAYFIAQHTGRDVNQIIAPPLDAYLKRNENTSRILGGVAKKYNIQIIEPWKALCTDAQCLAVVDNHSLYADAYHLSIFGSEYIAQIYDPFFEELAKSGR